jgi:inner membrane protein
MSLPRFRSAWRLGLLVALGLLLLIPLSMVRGLVSERQSRSQEVHREIASKWGESQTIAPPILSVPWTRTTTQKNGKLLREETWIRTYPESLAIDADLETQTRKRSLFEVPVYTVSMDLKGVWNPDDLRKSSPGPEWTPQWTRAVVSVDPGEARSLVRAPNLELAGRGLELSATVPVGGVAGCHLHAKADLSAETTARIAFRLQVVQRGSDEIAFVPAAGTTAARLRSDWASPSFQGSFLPDRSTITASGFDATWSVSSLNMEIPMTWRDEDHGGKDDEDDGDYGATSSPSTFAVSLLEPVDDYDSLDRSMKYGSLVVGLAFLALFVFEAFLDRALHPVQYGLIGLALALFYLLALSISEHLGFDTAYAISASVVTGLVTGYASSVLAGWKRGALLGTGLVALWSFLYTLLKAEDWALLMGSTGLFLILALVMWLTRRIDWNRRDLKEVEE